MIIALIIISICFIASVISLVILIEDKNYYKQMASEWEELSKNSLETKGNFVEYLFIAPIEGQGAHIDGQEVLFRVFADNEGDAIEKLQKICTTDKEFCDELCGYDELEIYAAYHAEDISPIDWLKGKVEDDFVE